MLSTFPRVAKYFLSISKYDTILSILYYRTKAIFPSLSIGGNLLTSRSFSYTIKLGSYRVVPSRLTTHFYAISGQRSTFTSPNNICAVVYLTDIFAHSSYVWMHDWCKSEWNSTTQILSLRITASSNVSKLDIGLNLWFPSYMGWVNRTHMLICIMINHAITQTSIRYNNNAKETRQKRNSVAKNESIVGARINFIPRIIASTTITYPSLSSINTKPENSSGIVS